MEKLIFKSKKSFKIILTIIVFSCLLCVGFLFGYFKYSATKKPAPVNAVVSLKENWYSKGGFTSEYLINFGFEKSVNKHLSTDIKGYFVEDVIYVYVPLNTDITALKASFVADGEVYINDKKLKNRKTKIDFSKPVTITVKGEQTFEYKVHVLKSNLPTVIIDTTNSNRVVSKTDYLTAKVSVDNGVQSFSYASKVRVRGNATAALPKLPYKIKLNNASKLLDLPSGKEFVLMANFNDVTLVRNELAYTISEQLGAKIVPQQTPVELVVNGEYCGTYYLGNQVEISKSSVDITKMNDMDVSGNNLTGGYLLEIDSRLYEYMEKGFYTNYKTPISINSPSKYTPEQLQYIQTYVNDFESCLYSENFNFNGKNLNEYIDIESFAIVYLTNEILKNTDFPGLSFYIYKDRQDVLRAGPVWDFDISAGNIVQRPEAMQTENWYTANGIWFDRLLLNDDFTNEVKRIFEANKQWLNEIEANIDIMINEVKAAVNNNFIRTYIGVNDYSNYPQDDPYDKEVETLKTWVSARIKWLNENMDNLDKYALTKTQ